MSAPPDSADDGPALGAAPGLADPGLGGPRLVRGQRMVKPRKAQCAADCESLEQLPNIGPSLAADLRLLGVVHPRELAARDAFVLYQSLCAITGKRQDPCVLDTFMAATDFMRGAEPRPWWAYTAQRKTVYGNV